jgi:hypothetical protein
MVMLQTGNFTQTTASLTDSPPHRRQRPRGHDAHGKRDQSGPGKPLHPSPHHIPIDQLGKFVGAVASRVWHVGYRVAKKGANLFPPKPIF